MYPVYHSPSHVLRNGKNIKGGFILEGIFYLVPFLKGKKNPRNHWPSIFHVKVEKILKGSLDSIPSPSLKILIMGEKVCLRCKGKTLLGVVNKLLKKKCFAL